MADENEVDRLARECREDASRINAEFWRVNVGDYARRCTRPLCLSAGSGWSAEIHVGELAALARVIANLPVIAGQLDSVRAVQAASAEQVRRVVREAFAKVSDLSGAEFAQRHIEDIATRVAAQMAGPGAGAPPTASETRIVDLQAAVGYEIERRDAALAQVADIEGRLARLKSTHHLTAGMLTGAGQRIAELLAAVVRMAPIVAAADAWLEDPCKGLGSHREHDLEAAVRAYRATDPAPGS